MDPTQAGVQLGDLIFQGNSPAGYDKALKERAGGLAALWSASRARAESMLKNQELAKREGLAGDLQVLGYKPAAAEAIANIVSSNDTVNLGDAGLFKNPNAPEALAGARRAAANGNLGEYNVDTALATGKPLRTTQVSGGVAYDPYGSPSQDYNPGPTAATAPIRQQDTFHPIHDLSHEERLAFFGKPGMVFDNFGRQHPGAVLDTDTYNAFLAWADEHHFNDLHRALPHYQAYLARTQPAAHAAAAATPPPGLGDRLLEDVKSLFTPSPHTYTNGAPYPDGTELRGKDGRMYVVRNGQPVAVK